MKTLAICFAFLSLSAIAQEQAPATTSADLANRASAVADHLSQIEDRLNEEDARTIRRALANIETILEDYGGGGDGGQPSAVCLSNGQSGGFQKFVPYVNGRTLGGYTSHSTCDLLIEKMAKGLICASNGQTGGFQNFTPVETSSGNTLGGSTSQQTCFNLIETANRNFMCVSNGQTGGFQKFTLFDRNSGQALGGSTSYDTCVGSIR